MAGSSYLKPFPPVPSYWGNHPLLRTRQKCNQGIALFMLVLPAREKEHAVILESEYEEDSTTYEITNTLWTIEYVFPKEKIARDVLEKAAQNIELATQDIELVRHRVEITKDFAKIIRDAWISVVKQTRYDDDQGIVLHGTGYFFKADNYFGETNSNAEGPPKKLIELGLLLESFAVAKEDDRETIKKQCVELAMELKKCGSVQEEEDKGANKGIL